MYIKIFFYIEKLQTQIQEITNQLQMLHLKQIQVIQPGAFIKTEYHMPRGTHVFKNHV